MRISPTLLSGNGRLEPAITGQTSLITCRKQWASGLSCSNWQN